MDTETALAWIVLAIILLFTAFWVIWFTWKASRIEWRITLKDGICFTGRRTWQAIWREGFTERAYQVVDSQNSLFKENTIVVLGFGSILYRVKI